MPFKQRNGEGLGRLAAEPRSPAPKTLADTQPSTVAKMGRIPETPPGVPTGFGLAASGGIAAKLSRLDSGDRGGVLSNSRLTI